MTDDFEGIGSTDDDSDREAVAMALSIAGEYHLQAEVVLFALYAMRDSPHCSIREALDIGLSEWDL